MPGVNSMCEKVRIHFIGSLVSQLDLKDIEIPYEEGINGDVLRRELRQRVQLLQEESILNALLFFLNGQPVKNNDDSVSVRPGETITVFLPVFGG